MLRAAHNCALLSCTLGPVSKDLQQTNLQNCRSLRGFRKEQSQTRLLRKSSSRLNLPTNVVGNLEAMTSFEKTVVIDGKGHLLGILLPFPSILSIY